MSLFDKKEKKYINEGINAVRTTEGAVLIDIRPKDEYQKNHIQGAINIPHNRLDLANNRIRNKDALIYVYGTYTIKPKKTVKALRKMGFTDIHSCGYLEEHHVAP